MTYTVRQVIIDIRMEVPGITDDLAFAYIQKVHRYLSASFILATQMFDVTVVAGQYQYTLDPTITTVRTTHFLLNNQVGVASNLTPASTFDWDVENPNWRFDPPAIPNEFAVGEGNLFLWPTPKDPTVSGYPILKLSAGVRTTLTRDSNIPWDVPPDVYIEGVKFHWASNNAKDKIQLYKALFDMQMDHLNELLPKVNHNFRQQITPYNDFTPAI